MFRSVLLRPFLAMPLCLLPASLAAQTAPSVSTEVVVSAEAGPEQQRTLGAAATVVDAAEIERSRSASLTDVFRAVPGLDVVRAGGPGGVTSLFLRGANSTQTLVLVDGVKLNSPFFGGVDLSSLSTVNLSRVEVVRGPFSALWGSEAIGGVVQILTRRAPEESFSARFVAGAGNGSTFEGMADAAVRTGPVTVTAGWRRTSTDGELPNESFDGTGWNGGVEWSFGGTATLGVAVRHDEGRTGVPFSGAVATPNRTTTADTTTLSVPLVATHGGTRLEATFLASWDRPTFSDPDDPYGFTSSETNAGRIGGRLVASRDVGAHRLSMGADYEHTSVTSRDAFGTPLDGATTWNWALFAEDRIALDGERLVVTAGIRQDENGAFGGATSPRATVAFLATPALKLRAAGGAAFRAPTTGELYYPFSGNPELKPERAWAWEAGAEYALAPRLTLEASYFWSDVTNLIQYDPRTYTNQNVGHARMQGVEAALRGDLGWGLVARISYGYLDARDIETGLPLLRRPFNRAAATVGKSFRKGGSFEVTARFVGSRPDLDASDFVTRVTMPSYVTVDLAGTLPPLVLHLAPYARLTNLFDRSYAEAAGFPATGRRFVAGLSAAF